MIFLHDDDVYVTIVNYDFFSHGDVYVTIVK